MTAERAGTLIEEQPLKNYCRNDCRDYLENLKERFWEKMFGVATDSTIYSDLPIESVLNF